MNKQETFDYVVNHLYKQGEPASQGASCRYRTAEGLSCAVGCLIPDSMYTENMEGFTVDMLPKQSGFSIPEEVRLYNNMLDSLQWVHDSWYCPVDEEYSFSQIEDQLKQVAADHDVVYNKPY